MGVKLRESFYFLFFDFLLKEINLTCVFSIVVCSGKILYREGEIEGNEKRTGGFILRKDSLAFGIGYREDNERYRFICSFNSSY